MPRELPEAKKSLPLNQEWATPPIPVEAAWASMQQILEREDRRLERRFLGKHAIFTLLTLCIAAVWLFFLPANNGTLINNPHQAMINPLLDTGRSPGPREAAQQEFYPTKSEFTEHLFYPLKKTYVKNKEEAEDREPASALHRAPAFDLHFRNKIMEVSAIQARFHKKINKRPEFSLSNKKTFFSKNKKFQWSTDDIFNSNTEEAIVEDQAGHHHSNLKELVSMQHRKKTSDKPLQGRPLQNDIIATTEIIVRTSNLLPLRFPASFAESKIPALKKPVATNKHPSLAMGLEWNFALPFSNAGYYFTGSNGKNQPYSIVVPGIWISKSLGRQEVMLTVTPYKQLTMGDQQVQQTTSFSSPMDSSRVIQTRSVVKIFGATAGLAYRYKMKKHLLAAAGIKYVLQNSALVKTSSTVERTGVQLASALQKVNYADSSNSLSHHYFSASLELCYRYKRIDFGARIELPLSGIYKPSSADHKILTGSLFCRWNVFR